MNRLQLVQRLALECGETPPTTTENQTGDALRLVTWIDQGWENLQTEHDDWDWMRSSNILGQGCSFQTTAGGFTYQLGAGVGKVGIDPAVFGKWDLETFRCNTTLQVGILTTEDGFYITTEDGVPIATGTQTGGFQDETFLDMIPYDTWRNAYMLGAMRTVQTRPVAVAIGPNKSVCLGPPSNGQYTVTADFFFSPSAMTGDSSEPVGLPKQFQMLIVYDAMRMYAGYEAAPEVMSRGDLGWTKMLAQLESTNMPRVEFEGALC